LNGIKKPISRGKLRQVLGKEYFILKRKWNWAFSKETYSKHKSESDYDFSVYKHRSLILRPLKDVDMYLQENKRTNLEIAIQHINHIEIKPNECFSLWKLVGRPTKRKGYLEGLVLKSGKIDRDIGGGLCQLGNLLFWIFAHSPLSVKERYRHGFDVFPDVKRKYWGGYSRHNQIVKITTSEHTETEKLLVENHAVMMYNPFLEK